MSGTKSDLRRAILRTAAMAHWKHDHTRRGIPCAVNDCPPGRTAGQEAAASILSRLAASNHSNLATICFDNGDFPHA